MDIDFMKRFVFYGLATLIVLNPLLIACGSDEGADGQDLADKLYQGVSFARTDAPNMPAIMLHQSGDSIVALSDNGGQRISGAIFRDKDGQSLTVWAGEDGLPERAFADGYTFLFDNYTENTVDVAFVAPDGSIQTTREVQIDLPEIPPLAPGSKANVEELSASQIFEAGSWFISIAGCGLNAVADVASGEIRVPVAAIACGATIAKIGLAVVAEINPDLEESAAGLGFAIDAGVCADTLAPTACASLILNVASIETKRAEDKIKQNQEQITTARQALERSGAIKGDIITGKDGTPMLPIPAGEFEMGDHFNESKPNELPVHTVSLDAFYMDVYEVTNARYATFLNEMGKHQGDGGEVWLDFEDGDTLIELTGGQYRPEPGFEDHPVVEVSWYGAAAYAQWVGKRLPTEAEWEYAARGGLVGKRYPWGDEAPDEGGQYRANYSPGTIPGDGYPRTAPVGSFPPNGYGLYEMAGNVWEWCMDAWEEDFYSRSPGENPVAGGIISFANDQFTNVTTKRALRGGGWTSNQFIPLSIHVSNRGSGLPDFTFFFIGFRCARSVAP